MPLRSRAPQRTLVPNDACMSIFNSEATPTSFDGVDRALPFGGIGEQPVYEVVAKCLAAVRPSGGTFVDVGFGDLRLLVDSLCDRYVGTDVMHKALHDDNVEFASIDVGSGRLPLDDMSVDIECAVEIAGMVENPRAFVRELVRIFRPGGWVSVSTIKDPSLRNLLTHAIRQQHQAFRDALYRLQITAPLAVDLHRVANKAGFECVKTEFTGLGRAPFVNVFYPGFVTRLASRWHSDLVLVETRKPGT